MIPISEAKRIIGLGGLDERLGQLYGKPNVEDQRSRYLSIVAEFERRFSNERSIVIVSAPGRTELGGNHTDHNNGRVLAGSVHLDTIVAASPRNDTATTLWSDGWDTPFIVDLKTLDPISDEEGTTSSLVRGVAAGFRGRGLSIGGFDACMESRVLPGSGLSSSASVEIAIGSILNSLYNDRKADPVTLARVGQFAENRYFGKPCGLMDQTACAYGGIIAIDFADPEKPVIEQVTYSFEAAGYALVVVDTGGNHADLTADYASIPAEMGAVAHELGAGVLRSTDRAQVVSEAASLRKNTGDRAILRALHYFADNERVTLQIGALRSDNIERYLHLVRKSGSSSWRLLQNCFTVKNPQEQGISLAIALTEHFLDGSLPGSQEDPDVRVHGASRVHGGGFAGTIQAYVPLSRADSYVASMESVFGRGCVTRLSIREEGAVEIL